LSGAWRRACFLAGVFVTAACVVSAGLYLYRSAQQRRAMELVLRALQARQSVTSVGLTVTRAYTPDGPVVLRGRVRRGEGRVAIEYLDGPARGTRILRRGDSVWRRGGRGPVHIQIGEHVASPEVEPKLVRSNYSAWAVGKQTIAGRPTTQVVLRQRKGRAGMDLWIDDANYFPLRTVAVDQHGRTVSDTVYEKIDYSAPPPPVGPPPQDKAAASLRVVAVSFEEAAKQCAPYFSALKPTYLPPGFSGSGWHLHRFPSGRSPAMEARYTDGLAPLSVIQMRAEGRRVGDRPGTGRGRGRGGAPLPPRPAPPRPRARAPRQGPPPPAQREAPPRLLPRRFERTSQAFGGGVIRQRSGVVVMVVGQAPPEELRKVADGVR